MTTVPAMPLQSLTSAISVNALLLWARDAGPLVLMHRLSVLAQVTAIGISVTAEATRKRLVVGVRALVRAECRLDAETLRAAGKVAHKRLGARVRRRVIGQLLLGDAAVAADAACKGLEASVVLHVAVEVVLCAKGVGLVATEPATFIVTVCAARPDQCRRVFFDVVVEVFG